MKKYRNFETMWIDLAEALQEYLNDNSFVYEISGCFNCVHFEILCDNEEAKEVNDFLDDYCMNHHEYV
jgi:hypothetical protein